MKYVYRNKNTKGIVELNKARLEYEESEHWERIEGDAPDREPDPDPIEVPTGSNPDDDDHAELSTQDVVNLVCDNLDEFENGQLEHLQSAIVDKLNSRVTAPSVESAQVEPGEAPESDAVKARDEGGDPGKQEVEATAAAEKLAKDEGISLSTVKPTGSDGQITIGDVRDAVKARDEG
jgi:pyruvate/2-oxoglutarate dehydrogenase complex dihydrolipoamide acyltransferase (E2) component